MLTPMSPMGSHRRSPPRSPSGYTTSIAAIDEAISSPAICTNALAAANHGRTPNESTPRRSRSDTASHPTAVTPNSSRRRAARLSGCARQATSPAT